MVYVETGDEYLAGIVLLDEARGHLEGEINQERLCIVIYLFQIAAQFH